MRFAVLLLLTGCASQGVPVQWVKTSPTEIHAVCRDMQRAKIAHGRIDGCAVKRDGVCYIYAPDFAKADTDKMATLGHELKHCFDGLWHQ